MMSVHDVKHGLIIVMFLLTLILFWLQGQRLNKLEDRGETK